MGAGWIRRPPGCTATEPASGRSSTGCPSLESVGVWVALSFKGDREQGVRERAGDSEWRRLVATRACDGAYMAQAHNASAYDLAGGDTILTNLCAQQGPSEPGRCPRRAYLQRLCCVAMLSQAPACGSAETKGLSAATPCRLLVRYCPASVHTPLSPCPVSPLPVLLVLHASRMPSVAASAEAATGSTAGTRVRDA